MPDYSPWYNNSYALVIGIDTYADPQFHPLGKAEQDAEAMAEMLAAAPYGFEVQTLLGAKATRLGILSALYSYYETDPDDRVLVYFSGHGYTLTNKFGHETGYFACYDTESERDFTALKMDEVTGLREKANAKHIAFIFDACFSGQALGLTKATTGAADQFMLRRAYQVISAGAPDQTVDDYLSMTHYLLPLLRNPNETLTLETIGVALKQTVTDASKGMQIPQHGQITGSQGGDFVFLVSGGDAYLLCPYCLSKIRDDFACKYCGRSLTPGLLKQAQQHSAYMLPLSHSFTGKTVLTQGIIRALANISDVSDYAPQPIDFHSSKTIADLEKDHRTGEYPHPTQWSDNFFLISLLSAQVDRNKLVCIYDSGDFTLRLSSSALVRNYVKYSPILWLVVDPTFHQNPGCDFSDVLERLGELEKDANASIANRTIIVSYTFGDRILDKLPIELSQYLIGDPFSDLGTINGNTRE